MSNNRVNWLITDNHVTVNYNGQTHIVARTDKLADRLIEAVKAQDWKKIPELVSAAKRIEKFSKGTFTVQDGRIMVNGVEAPAALGQKILRFSNDGLPYQPLVKFAENLLKNPSYRAVNELFQFLEKNDHPITESGCFIAYKRVRHDFMDIYTGTFDNSVGKEPSVPRNQVDEDCTRTCSHGLHVANWDYAHTKYSQAANDIMLEVEVNPADVVAVPADYDQSKMRVCKYKVLGVVDKEHSSEVALRMVDTSVRFDQDEDEKEDEGNGECESCGDVLAICCSNHVCCECTDDAEEEEETEECDRCGDSLEDCCPAPFCCGCDADDLEDEEEDGAYPFDNELE